MGAWERWIRRTTTRLARAGRWRRWGPWWAGPALACACATAVAAPAAFHSGSLASTTDTTSGVIEFTLAQAMTVTLQSFGFGGGTSAAGPVVAAGGFDPFVSLFAGWGGSAVFLVGTSDIMTDYGLYSGCPPAGQVGIFGCGDVRITRSLAAGHYTVVVTTASNIPNALFADPGMPGDDPAVDLTLAAGFGTLLVPDVFQTCLDAERCIGTTSDWALDITAAVLPPDPGEPGQTVPEPGSVALVGAAAAAALVHRRRRRAASAFFRPTRISDVHC